MGLQRTSAIILNHQDFGESDKIVTFFSPSFGKIKGIAKGAKNSRKRFANQLELFSLVRAIFFEKSSSLSRIEECDVLESFGSIREAPLKYAYSAYFSELVDSAVKECDPHTELFHLLVWAFRCIDQGASLGRLSVLFQVRLLSIIGYAPTLTTCTGCQLWKEGNIYYSFNHEKGGILCPECSPGYASNRLSPGILKVLSLAQRMPIDKLSRLQFGSQSLSEAEQILETFTQNVIGKEIKSLRFLSQTRKFV
ncbi:MAG: DNA repair protein RecO [Pseudomonadota bacterium]